MNQYFSLNMNEINCYSARFYAEISMFSEEMGEQNQKREDLSQLGSDSSSDHTHLKRKNKKPVKKDIGYCFYTHIKKG